MPARWEAACYGLPATVDVESEAGGAVVVHPPAPASFVDAEAAVAVQQLAVMEVVAGVEAAVTPIQLCSSAAAVGSSSSTQGVFHLGLGTAWSCAPCM